VKRNLWIINDYAGSPTYGMSYRHYHLAKELQKNHCDVTIVSASYSHFLKRLPRTKGQFTHQKVDGVDFLWVRTLHYGKAHDPRRVVKWFQFALLVLWLPFSGLRRPDQILVSPTAVFPAVTAWLVARLLGAKLIFEVRDIWPLTLVELGGYTWGHPFILLISLAERFALRHSDAVISNLPSYATYLKSLGIDRPVTIIPNGVSLSEMAAAEPLSPSTTQRLPQGKFVVGYAGTLGHANALGVLLEAARLLKDEPEVEFVLVGQGKDGDDLRQSAHDLPQVHFLPPVPKGQVQALLATFSVCYLGLPRRRVFEYGVSPNKLYDYMYSRRPVLFGVATELDEVKLSGCGLSVEPESATAVAEGIRTFLQLSPQARDEMGNRGHEYVLHHHDYAKLAQSLDEVLN